MYGAIKTSENALPSHRRRQRESCGETQTLRLFRWDSFTEAQCKLNNIIICLWCELFNCRDERNPSLPWHELNVCTLFNGENMHRVSCPQEDIIYLKKRFIAHSHTDGEANSLRFAINTGSICKSCVWKMKNEQKSAMIVEKRERRRRVEESFVTWSLIHDMSNTVICRREGRFIGCNLNEIRYLKRCSPQVTVKVETLVTGVTCNCREEREAETDDAHHRCVSYFTVPRWWLEWRLAPVSLSFSRCQASVDKLLGQRGRETRWWRRSLQEWVTQKYEVNTFH